MADLKNLFAIANDLGDWRLGGLVQTTIVFANEWAPACQLVRILVSALSRKRTLTLVIFDGGNWVVSSRSSSGKKTR